MIVIRILLFSLILLSCSDDSLDNLGSLEGTVNDIQWDNFHDDKVYNTRVYFHRINQPSKCCNDSIDIWALHLNTYNTKAESFGRGEGYQLFFSLELAANDKNINKKITEFNRSSIRDNFGSCGLYYSIGDVYDGGFNLDNSKNNFLTITKFSCSKMEGYLEANFIERTSKKPISIKVANFIAKPDPKYKFVNCKN
jgi:hypothetical protein